MASPQCENGYLRLAVEIQEQLCKFRIPGGVRQIVDTVIRKTYGYHKKEDRISNSQFIESTGMTKGNVSRELSKAITHRIVIKSDNKYRFNKNYDEWVSFKRVIKSDNKQKVIKKGTKVIKSDNKKLSKVRDTKDNKDIIQKINTYRQQSCPEADEIMEFFKETYGFRKSVPKHLQNWRAAKWLYEQYGVERTCRAILAGKSALEESVAGAEKVPIVKNLMDLKEKYDQLRAYYGRKRNRDKKNLDLSKI